MYIRERGLIKIEKDHIYVLWFVLGFVFLDANINHDVSYLSYFPFKKYYVKSGVSQNTSENSYKKLTVFLNIFEFNIFYHYVRFLRFFLKMFLKLTSVEG